MSLSAVCHVPMRDGIRLSTQVFTPGGGGSWPVVVARTPYAKAGVAQWLAVLAGKGYAVVVQDVRGTGQSEGVFDILGQEPADAVDTAGWILGQPFCNGALGILGLSYLAPASVAIASTFTEETKACVWLAPVMGGSTIFLENGALRLHHSLPWMALRHPKFRDTDWRQALRHLPLRDALASVGIDEPVWVEASKDLTAWWNQRDVTTYFQAVKAPGLHFGGLWDFMLSSSFAGHQAISLSSAPQPLVLGPWSHNGVAPELTRNAYADYGPEASSGFFARVLGWFNHWLKDEALPAYLGHPYSIFVPGHGWETSATWPVTGSRQYRLFLGERTLEPALGTTGSLAYLYDPADPVPTEGGALWEFSKIGLEPGPSPVTTGGRPDVLTFVGSVLSRDLIAAGPAEVRLFVESDAPSTDFTAKVVDLPPNGAGRVVADSIYRWQQSEGEALTIRFDAIGYRFAAGHRVRLDVSSSNFPKYDRNLNTGVSDLVSATMRVARQTIRFGSDAPSEVTLTVL